MERDPHTPDSATWNAVGRSLRRRLRPLRRLRLRHPIGSGALVIALMTCTICSLIGVGTSLEADALNLRFRIRAALEQDSSGGSVSIVSLRLMDESESQHGLRSDLTSLLEQLAAQPQDDRPLALVLDVLLSHPPQPRVEGFASMEERLQHAAAELGTLVHPVGVQYTIHGSDYPVLPQGLVDHLLPSTVSRPTRSAVVLEFAHPVLAEPLYHTALGVGAVTVLPDYRRDEPLYHLPMWTSLSSQQTGSHASGQLLPALSLAAVLGVLCAGTPPVDCLQGYRTSQGYTQVVKGAGGLKVPLDERGNLEINYRGRFSLGRAWRASGAGKGAGSELRTEAKTLREGQTMATDCPRLLAYVSPEGEAPGQLRGPDGELDARLLARCFVLVVDNFETDSVLSPLGPDERQAFVHAQLLSNILEQDFLVHLPAWGEALLVLILMVGLWGVDWPKQVLDPHMEGKVNRPTHARWMSPLSARVPLMLVGWSLLSVGLFMVWSFVLPLAVPSIGMMAYGVGKSALSLPVLRQKLERVTAKRRQLRQELDIVSGQANGVARLLQSSVSLPDELRQEAERQLGVVQRVLDGEEASSSAAVLLATIAPDDGTDAVKLHGLLVELQSTLKRYGVQSEEWREEQQSLEGIEAVAGQQLERLRRLHVQTLRVVGRLARLMRVARRPAPVPEPANTHVSNTSHVDQALKDQYGFVTADPELIRELRLALHRYALEKNANILLLGETGVGKEVLAQAICQASGWKQEPLCINCAALQSTTLEGELFGYGPKSPLVNADPQGRMGIFEAAGGGWVFLDEVGELSPDAQAKLLRVLQERKVRRMFANDERSVSFRLIAATCADLAQLVETGKFRADLYERLRRHEVRIPPVRSRRCDIQPQLEYFIREWETDHPGTRLLLDADAERDMVEAYHWPRNTRQIRNELHGLATRAAFDPETCVQREEVRITRPMLHRALGAPDVRVREMNPPLATTVSVPADANWRASREESSRYASVPDSLTPEELNWLTCQRRNRFSPKACEEDADYKVNDKNADLHRRKLSAKLLCLVEMDERELVRVLVGEDAALQMLVAGKVRQWLDRIASWTPDEMSKRLPEYGTYKRYVERIHEALKRGEVLRG